MTGRKFGRLLVIERGDNIGSRAAWVCSCDCGKRKTIEGKSLRKGATKSCGCLQKELTSKRFLKHGEADKTSLYGVWCTLKQRCNTETSDSYHYYGGRGIKLYEPWNKFENFKAWSLNSGYKEGLTIERRNVNGNYEPSNCEWIPAIDQATNKRTSIIIKAFGERKVLSEWARDKRCVVGYQTLYHRVKKMKLKPEDAITKSYEELRKASTNK